jgi:photosystem II stability/assembly factor-like uncharacterized protein
MKTYWMIGTLCFIACSNSKPVATQETSNLSVRTQTSYNCTSERVYASLLSTRRHRLSGENPIVGVYDSRDGGRNWTHTGWPQGRHFAIATEPSTCGVIRYVAAGNGLFRTLDDGRTWRITTDWQQTEIQEIAVSTLKVQHILIGTPYGIFRSENRGDNWQEVNQGLDQRFTSSIRFDRTNADRAIAGTESGVYISNDGGRTWMPTNLNEPVRSVRQSPDNPSMWVAGLQHKGAATSDDFGKTWQISPSLNGKTMYQIEFGLKQTELWAGGWEVGVWYSPDFGMTWQHRSEGIAYTFIHSIAISREHPGRIWAGSMGGGLFRSDDHGKNWTESNRELFEAGQIWDLFIDTEQ